MSCTGRLGRLNKTLLANHEFPPAGIVEGSAQLYVPLQQKGWPLTAATCSWNDQPRHTVIWHQGYLELQFCRPQRCPGHFQHSQRKHDPPGLGQGQGKAPVPGGEHGAEGWQKGEGKDCSRKAQEGSFNAQGQAITRLFFQACRGSFRFAVI